MPDVATSPSALTADAVTHFARQRGEPDFLVERRRLALDTWNALPLPGRQDEIWRRVKLAGVDLEAAVAWTPPGEALSLNPTTANGVFWGGLDRAIAERPALLRSHWATAIYPAGDAGRIGRRGGKFHALNQARYDTGFVLHVPAGLKHAPPFHATVRPAAGAAGTFPHNLVVLEEGAEVTLIEEYAGPGAGLCNPQTEIALEPGARLHYILVQDLGAQATYIGAHRARLRRGAHVTFSSAHLGAALSKTFLEAELAEPNAEALIHGFYFGRGRQQLDLDTWQHHLAPACRSDLLMKGVLDEAAHAVYRGMIRLEPDAQKTDAYQQNRTLLLSPDACVHSIPGLEIQANDVRCTHGATAGQVDPEMLFYLCSRGLFRDQARKMIVDGFLEDVLLKFGDEGVIGRLREGLDARLGGPRAGADPGRGQ